MEIDDDVWCSGVPLAMSDGMVISSIALLSAKPAGIFAVYMIIAVADVTTPVLKALYSTVDLLYIIYGIVYRAL